MAGLLQGVEGTGFENFHSSPGVVGKITTALSENGENAPADLIAGIVVNAPTIASCAPLERHQ
jgi:hypothetical protein